MKELFLQILIVAYAATGIVAVVGYWPTIKDLYHHKKQSANVASYVIWTATNIVALLYAVVFIDDLLLQIVTGISCAANIVILFLSIGLKK